MDDGIAIATRSEMTEEEKRLAYNEKQRLKMAARLADPEARKAESERQRQYVAARKLVDPDFAEAVRKTKRKHYETNIKPNPARMAEHRANVKQWRLDVLADPIRGPIYVAENKRRAKDYRKKLREKSKEICNDC